MICEGIITILTFVKVRKVHRSYHNESFVIQSAHHNINFCHRLFLTMTFHNCEEQAMKSAAILGVHIVSDMLPDTDTTHPDPPFHRISAYPKPGQTFIYAVKCKSIQNVESATSSLLAYLTYLPDLIIYYKLLQDHILGRR